MHPKIKMSIRAYVASFAPRFGAGGNILAFLHWVESTGYAVNSDELISDELQQRLFLHLSALHLRTLGPLLDSLSAIPHLGVDGRAIEQAVTGFFKASYGDSLREKVWEVSKHRTHSVTCLFVEELVALYWQTFVWQPALSHGYVVKEDEDAPKPEPNA